MTTTKTYTNTDKLSTDVTYTWSAKIERKTENNNALIKCPPMFLSDVQKVNAGLSSDRAIKEFLCKTLSIEFKEEYMHFLNTPMVAPVVADKSDVDLSKVIMSAYAKGHKEADIIAKLESAGITKEQLAPHFKSLQTDAPVDLNALF